VYRSAVAEEHESPQRSRPDAAEMVLLFVNTRADAGGRVELFGTGADFAAWACEHELLTADSIVTDSDAAAARELRDALVTVMLAHAGDLALDGNQISLAETYLRQVGTRYPLCTILTTQGAQLTATSPGAPGVLGTVLAAATEVAQCDDWLRIKACCNPPCHNGFRDRTRNRAGRYCNPGCGSQASMRAFRERQRDTESTPPGS
jgi:predicted RNA-binding Zn ribbon-like protein